MYKILIVEDEKLLREGLIRMLDYQQFQLVLCGEASNGKEAIRLIKEEEPNLVLLDLNIPLVDGLEVLRRTKNKYLYEAIIITGYAEFDYAQQAITYGVSDYLLKPINQDDLNLAIARAINKINPTIEEVNENYSKYTIRTLNYINKNISDDLLLDDIASYLGITSDHLNRVFKKDTNMTIHNAIVHARITKACELLRNEGSKIYEVAMQVGYKDYKYFHQVFKKITGQSPREYMFKK